MTQRLQSQSIEAALAHLSQFGDTDLFPKPFEIAALEARQAELKAALLHQNLADYHWNGSARRCVVPKDRLSYRIATQLDPLDALVLTAIIFQYGEKIEQKRVPETHGIVHSYRFRPTAAGQLYDLQNQWSRFWTRSREISLDPKNRVILVADVSDFYNQIDHHTLENRLGECGIPQEVFRSVLNLLGILTQTVSKGLPVGPQAVHLLAEISLDSIDRSLIAQGRDYCRFVDDLHIGCSNEGDAALALAHLADVLDKHQRLTLQRHKLRLVPSDKFSYECEQKLRDQTTDQNEERIIQVISRATPGQYATVALHTLDPADLISLAQDKLETLLSTHLGEPEPNFARIRWLLRRLSQIGVPGAVDFVVENIGELAPCIEDACRYLISAAPNYTGDWQRLGASVLEALDWPHVRGFEYAQAVLIHLFASNPSMDNIEQLISRYQDSPTMSKRKIVLAATATGASHWIHERKGEWETVDPWLRRAIIASSSALPRDERRHWLRHVQRRTRRALLDQLVVAWATR